MFNIFHSVNCCNPICYKISHNRKVVIRFTLSGLQIIKIFCHVYLLLKMCIWYYFSVLQKYIGTPLLNSEQGCLTVSLYQK